jgi:hypothetical protein
MSLETADFTIRPIEIADASGVRDAVLANQERLEHDFPQVVSRHQDIEVSRAGIVSAAYATADPSSGYDVLVATDPDNTRIYGVGTRQRLGTRANRALRLSSVSEREFPVLRFTGANLVAGWTTAGHPSGLALAGLTELLSGGMPTDSGYGTNFMNITFVRPPNRRAVITATQAGMKEVPAHSSLVFTEASPKQLIGSFGLRLAGLSDGVKDARKIYAIHRPIFQADRRLG